ncbi:MAG: glutathione S-transferase family protein [Parvibaculales bacterium]
MKLKLYGAPLSPYVRKVRMLLGKKGIAYDYDPRVSPLAMPEDYEKIHPLKRIPAMVIAHDGGETSIPDSSAICAFVEKAFPDTPFYPADPVDYAKALWLEEYGDTELGPNGTAAFFRTIFFSWATGSEPDMSAVEQGFENIKRFAAYIDGELGGNDWLIGDTMSIADISIAVHFVNISHAGYDLMESDGAALHGLVERVCADPVMAELIAGEGEAIASLGFEKPDLNAYRSEKGL